MLQRIFTLNVLFTHRIVLYIVPENAFYCMYKMFIKMTKYAHKRRGEEKKIITTLGCASLYEVCHCYNMQVLIL